MPLGNCHFHHFGLIVTGEGEEKFLPRLFKGVMQTGLCHFEVIARVGQRSPITSPKRLAKMVGTNRAIPDRDFTEIGAPARGYMKKRRASCVLLVDDIEYSRLPFLRDVFDRYEKALNNALGDDAGRASVHFLVPMLEAYYFADNSAINGILGTETGPFSGDVETMRHPKGELKRLFPVFDEVRHGAAIIEALDINAVLGDPSTCAFLRAAYAWCYKALGLDPDPRFCLDTGAIAIVTGHQIAEL